MTLFPFNANGFVRRSASSGNPPSALSKQTTLEPREPRSTAAPNPSWGLFTLAVIAAAAFFEILQWPLTPRSLDMYYHMAVADGFRQAGGYVTQAFWEYAPAGRPHLYPPLLHFILLALRSLGLSVVDSARLVEVAAHPVTLWALWASVRKFSGPSAAFFAVLFWASVHSVYAAAFNFPAETLAFVFGLGAFAAFEDRNRPRAVLFLALAFYSHGLFPWVLAAALVLYGFASRRPRGAALTAFAALLAASPFLAHQIFHAGSFHFERVVEDTRLEIDLTVAAFAIAGFFLFLKGKIRAAAPLCLLIAAAPFLFVYRARLTGGHGLVGAVWLAALAAEQAYDLIASRRAALGRVFLAAGAVWIAVVSPLAVFTASGARFEWGAATFSKLLRHPVSDVRTSGLYHEKYVGEIVDAVRAHSAPDEIFWTDLNYAGALVSALSGRATSTAALREVRPDVPADPVAAAKVAVCFKTDDGGEPAWVEPFAKKYGLDLADETTWALIYKNPRPTPHAEIPRAGIPSGIIFLCLGSCAWVAVRSAKR